VFIILYIEIINLVIKNISKINLKRSGQMDNKSILWKRKCK